MNTSAPLKAILASDTSDQIELSPLEYEIINYIIGKTNNRMNDILSISLEDEGVLDANQIKNSIHGIIERFIVSRYLEFIFGCKLIPIEVKSLDNGNLVVGCKIDNKKIEIPLVLYTDLHTFIQKKEQIQGEIYDGDDIIICHYNQQDIESIKEILERTYEKKYAKTEITRDSLYGILKELPDNEIDVFDIGFEVPLKKEYPSRKLQTLYEQMREKAMKIRKSEKGKKKR